MFLTDAFDECFCRAFRTGVSASPADRGARERVEAPRDHDVLAKEARHLGSGRNVVSGIKVPNMLVNLVRNGQTVVQLYKATMRPSPSDTATIRQYSAALVPPAPFGPQPEIRRAGAEFSSSPSRLAGKPDSSIKVGQSLGRPCERYLRLRQPPPRRRRSAAAARKAGRGSRRRPGVGPPQSPSFHRACIRPNRIRPERADAAGQQHLLDPEAQRRRNRRVLPAPETAEKGPGERCGACPHKRTTETDLPDVFNMSPHISTRQPFL